MSTSNLGDVRNKAVEITLGERTYNLLYDLNAFADIEESHGSITDLLNQMEKGSAKAIRAMIWAGLQTNENPPTEKEVGALISMGDMESIAQAIQKALIKSMPEGKNEKN
jgi:hypothetical protein